MLLRAPHPGSPVAAVPRTLARWRARATLALLALLVQSGGCPETGAPIASSGLPPLAIVGPIVRSSSGVEGQDVQVTLGETVTVEVDFHAADGRPPDDYFVVWSHQGEVRTPAPGVETLTFAPQALETIAVSGTIWVCGGTAWVPRLHCGPVFFGTAVIRTWGGTATALTFPAKEATLALSEIRPMQASATAPTSWEDGRALRVVASDTVGYAMDDPSVASVDAHGVVTALAPGTTTLRAVAGAEAASMTVTVTSAPLARPPAGQAGLPGAEAMTLVPAGTASDDTLTLDAREWPTVAFAAVETPEAWVAPWTGTGFGRERMSAAADVATLAQLVRGVDGSLWGAYQAEQTHAWVVSERVAMGDWRTLVLPPHVDPGDAELAGLTQVAALTHEDTGARVLFAMRAATADDPAGGVWAAYVIANGTSTDHLGARADRRVRLARVTAGKVETVDVDSRCSAGTDETAPDPRCSDTLARRLPGGIWLVASGARTPHVVLFDADRTVTLLSPSVGADPTQLATTWTRRTIFPRPVQGGGATGDGPSDFNILHGDRDDPQGTDLWAWRASGDGVAYQAVRTAGWTPYDTDPISAWRDNYYSWAGDSQATAARPRLPGAIAADGTSWIGWSSLAPMGMTLPDGTHSWDELGAWVRDADEPEGHSLAAVTSVGVAGFLARRDRLHFLILNGRSAFYANFARARITSLDGSDAVDGPGRALAMDPWERPFAPPVVLADGRRLAFVATDWGTGPWSYGVQTAAGPDQPWGTADWRQSGEQPAVAAFGDSVFMTGPSLYHQVLVLDGGGSWRPLQPCQATAPIVSLAGASDGAVWALASDTRLYRVVDTHGLGIAPEVGVGALPFGIDSSAVGLAASGTSAYLVAASPDGAGVLVNRYEASGLVDSSVGESTLPPTDLDLRHPVATADGRLCLLQRSTKTPGVVRALYQGHVFCSADLFRATSATGRTPTTQVALGAGDWLDARLDRMQDGRLLVTATRALSHLHDEAVAFVSSDGLSWSDAIELRPDGGYGQTPIGCAPETDGTLICLVRDNLGHSNWSAGAPQGYPGAPPRFPIAVHVRPTAP